MKLTTTLQKYTNVQNPNQLEKISNVDYKKEFSLGSANYQINNNFN